MYEHATAAEEARAHGIRQPHRAFRRVVAIVSRLLYWTPALTQAKVPVRMGKGEAPPAHSRLMRMHGHVPVQNARACLDRPERAVQFQAAARACLCLRHPASHCGRALEAEGDDRLRSWPRASSQNKALSNASSREGARALGCLEYGTRSLRGRPQQPPPKAPKDAVAEGETVTSRQPRGHLITLHRQMMP